METATGHGKYQSGETQETRGILSCYVAHLTRVFFLPCDRAPVVCPPACAASRTPVSLAQRGETRKEVSGSTAYPKSKDVRDKSMPLTWQFVLQDPCDMVKPKLVQP